ncbi:MAG TPA: hypothetical protein VIT91_10995 [Chthoniobacterales bacterium]
MIPVRLKCGASETFSPGGGFTGVESTQVQAKVEDLAAVKDVVIHYKDFDTWTDAVLTGQKDFGDYVLFSGHFSFLINQFVLRFTSGGQSFWDNNNGMDYRFDDNRRGAVGGHVILHKATARRGSQSGGGFTFTTSWIEGEILVTNLSYNKHVGIRWTSNNWATFEDTEATYAGVMPMYASSSGVEVWKFKTPEYNLKESPPQFQFAIFYHKLDSGTSFWDNNFSHNYTLSKADGAVLE